MSECAVCGMRRAIRLLDAANACVPLMLLPISAEHCRMTNLERSHAELRAALIHSPASPSFRTRPSSLHGSGNGWRQSPNAPAQFVPDAVEFPGRE
jgi:hypothetical protein